MKLLFCLDCGDMIAPLPKPNLIRVCNCEHHAVWWADPKTGQIRVCDMIQDKKVREQTNGAPVGPARCFIIGIDNDFLLHKGQLSRKTISEIAKSSSPTMLFHSWESCVVRFLPGETSDSAWADVPDRAETVH